MSVLLADIGGTNIRVMLLKETEISSLNYYKTNDYNTLQEVLSTYLKTTGVTPKKMVFGVAGVIQNDITKLTNADFTINLNELKKTYPDTDILLVNDFELQGWGILKAKEKDLRPLADETKESFGRKLVLGPGTGLGSCFLIPHHEEYQVLSSEAGHSSLSAITPNQQKILAEITKEESPLSFEDILSGSGLLRLYQAILKINQQAQDSSWISETESMKNAFKISETSEADIFPLRPKEVTELAIKNDEIALLTFWYFFEFLGIYASNLALTLKTKAGVYLVGNLLNQQMIRNLLLKSNFKKYFYYKKSFADYLKNIPVFLVEQQDIQLNGLVYLAKNALK